MSARSRGRPFGMPLRPAAGTPGAARQPAWARDDGHPWEHGGHAAGLGPERAQRCASHVAGVWSPAPGHPHHDDDIVRVFSVGEAPPAGADVDGSALARAPLLLYDSASHTRRSIDSRFAQAGFAPRPVMELRSMEATKELVQASLGCSARPGLSVSGAEAPATLAVRSLPPTVRRSLALVARRDKVPDRSSRTVPRPSVRHHSSLRARPIGLLRWRVRFRRLPAGSMAWRAGRLKFALGWKDC